MSAIAKAFEAVTAYTSRWARERVNRKLDNRDTVLSEALRVSERRPDTVYPLVQKLSQVSVSKGGAAETDLTLTGKSFIGICEKPVATSGVDGVAGSIDWEAVLPGDHSITVSITDDGSALGLTIVGRTIEIVHGAGGAGTGGKATAAEVVAFVNAHATAKYMVNATQNTAGDATDDSVELTGGKGDVLTMFIGDVELDGTAGFGITNVTDTAITFDFDQTGETIGERLLVNVSVDGVPAYPISVDVVA